MTSSHRALRDTSDVVGGITLPAINSRKGLPRSRPARDVLAHR